MADIQKHSRVFIKRYNQEGRPTTTAASQKKICVLGYKFIEIYSWRHEWQKFSMSLGDGSISNRWQDIDCLNQWRPMLATPWGGIYRYTSGLLRLTPVYSYDFSMSQWSNSEGYELSNCTNQSVTDHITTTMEIKEQNDKVCIFYAIYIYCIHAVVFFCFVFFQITHLKRVNIVPRVNQGPFSQHGLA